MQPVKERASRKVENRVPIGPSSPGEKLRVRGKGGSFISSMALSSPFIQAVKESGPRRVGNSASRECGPSSPLEKLRVPGKVEA